jgi:hypothetical protein
MTNYIHTCDLKLASILAALGIPRREQDPVTSVINTTSAGQEKEQYTFWFDVSNPSVQEKAKTYVKAYYAAEKWESFTLDTEHPLYWMKGALENREVFLHWMRTKVAPMKQIQHGNKTVLMGARATRKTQETIRGQL